jgi:hypothetical protein
MELIATNKTVSLEFLFCVVLGSYEGVVILTVPRAIAPPWWSLEWSRSTRPGSVRFSRPSFFVFEA